MQSEQNYFNVAPCCFFVFDDNGIIKEANETLCTLTGYSRESLLNFSVEKIFTIPTRIFYQTHLFPLLKLQSYAEEIYLTLCTHKGDQLPILCHTTKMMNEQGSRYLCVGIIVRNRKKYEDELISAKKMAEKALNENTELNKVKEELIHHTETLDRSLTMVNRQNQELMQFNRAVTHDLQEPLRKISLFLNMMQHGVTDNAS